MEESLRRKSGKWKRALDLGAEKGREFEEEERGRWKNVMFRMRKIEHTWKRVYHLWRKS